MEEHVMIFTLNSSLSIQNVLVELLTKAESDVKKLFELRE